MIMVRSIFMNLGDENCWTIHRLWKLRYVPWFIRKNRHLVRRNSSHFSGNGHDRERELKSLLSAICDFLTPLLPVANGHMVNFFSQGYWTVNVPLTLRNDLNSVAESSSLLDLYFSMDALSGIDGRALGNEKRACRTRTFPCSVGLVDF